MKQLTNMRIKSIAMMFFMLPITALAQKTMFQRAFEEPRKPGLAYQARKEVDMYLFSLTKERIENFCKESNYKIVRSYDVNVTPRGSSLKKFLLIYDVVPMSEYSQYENELNTLKNGGMLDYTRSLPKYPTDDKSRKKAEKYYEKGEKYGHMDDYHEAAQLGHPMAKAKEARMHMKLRTNTQNEAMARQMVNELILLDDPKIWEATYDIMSKDGKAYVDWCQGKTKDVPFRFLWQYKGREIAEQKLKEGAEAGVTSAQKELGKQFWHGQYITHNKKEAVKWILPLAKDDQTLRDYVIVAKGEGLYEGNIPTDWYNHEPTQLVKEAAKQGNKEAQFLLSNRGDKKELMSEIEKGNGQAAELLDAYTKTQAYVMEKEMLSLLKNSSKTKYDKYGADVKLLNEIYQDAVQYHKSGKAETFDKRKDFAKTFYTFYTKYPQYDKKRMVKKAQLIVDFCKVTDALYILREDPQLWEYKREGFLSMDLKPVYTGAENYIFKDLEDAVAICNKQKTDPTLGGFFAKCIPLLKQKTTRVKEFVKSDTETFNKKLGEYKQEQIDRQTKKVNTERANSAKVPTLKRVREGDHGRFIDSDNNYDDTDYFDYSDGTSVEVHHRYIKGDTNYYYVESIGKITRYMTARDAADAGWVFEKMKVVRTIGKIE